MSKISRSKPSLLMPSAAEEASILRGALSDVDAQPLSSEQLAQMRPLRGRPKSESKKILLSVRYSPEVVDYFRSTGDGWQARMDDALKQWVKRRTARSP
jgi:uncharacterized protein (DUF4415 family)